MGTKLAKLTTEEVSERIRKGYYDNQKPYETLKKNPTVHEAYEEEKYRVRELFKKEALEAVGLKKHPKAEKAWNFAWDEGHGNGYNEVFMYLERIAEIALD